MYNNRRVIAVLEPQGEDIQKCSESVESLLKNTIIPDLIHIRVQSRQDVTSSLLDVAMRNPIVKLLYNGVAAMEYDRDDIIIDINCNQEIDDVFIMAKCSGQTIYYVDATKPKVFIKFIIPCWGVEKDIGRMLDSILSQSFHDYHIVCVEDCSLDNTWNVLKSYSGRFPDKITLIKNPYNLGAGQSRNQGYFHTLTTIPSDFLWFVDGDDYLADPSVLQRFYDFQQEHRNLDIINVGWTCDGKYDIAKLGWPIGLPGRIIRPNVYVPGLFKNLPKGNDVYSHFLMFDMVDDSRIGSFDYNCYIYPKPGKHHNTTAKDINTPVEIGKSLMKYRFRKLNVVNILLGGKSGTGKWIKNNFPEFKPKMIYDRRISIVMASFPFRKKWMLRCIEQLIDQCDDFYLWLNEYDEIPYELNRFDKNKLHITLGDVNLRENGRYLFLDGKCRDDYCFICDDDIEYPPDYVENTLGCFQRNGEDIVVAYYILSTKQFLAEHKCDEIQNIHTNAVVPHYRFGLGVTTFVPSLMKFEFTYDELLANYDIEMFIGEQCVNRGIRVITPKRRKNFVSFVRDSYKDCDVDKHALHLNGSKERIKYTADYMMNKTKGRKAQ